jgi:ABC-type phosphate/phosphonate transport system substrate-binding protein
MCGYPIAQRLAPVVPIAAPIPSAAWAKGRPVYRTDLIVRVDAPYQHLEDTFGGRAGYTVAHSHSGFNAFRHHLLGYRNPQRPLLYGQMQGELITARNILDSVREGRIDVGPLDAYWHELIARHAPQLTSGVRVIESTSTAPMPALVAGSSVPAASVARLREALLAASERPWFGRFAEVLLLEGFAAMTEGSYEVVLEREREAKAAGYDQPG